MDSDETILDRAPLVIEPGTSGVGALEILGFTPAQIVALQSISDMLSLDPLEKGLQSTGWTALEHLQELVAIARNAPKPGDRMKAMAEIRALVIDAVKMNQQQITATRKVEYRDDHGNTVTDSVQFSRRYLEGPGGQRPSAFSDDYSRRTPTHGPDPVDPADEPLEDPDDDFD